MSRPSSVLLGVTGSVAAIKTEEIANEISGTTRSGGDNINVQIVPTPTAERHFVPDSCKHHYTVHTDAADWACWRQLGDDVLHIQLMRRADLLVIAPLDANTLAKLSYGLCDNLLTCIARAWDFKKPFLVFPAMNTNMWLHPITREQITKLESFGIQVFPPVEKKLACGETGMGGLPNPEFVADCVRKCLSHSSKPLGD